VSCWIGRAKKGAKAPGKNFAANTRPAPCKVRDQRRVTTPLTAESPGSNTRFTLG
jgi:hypothetical protein